MLCFECCWDNRVKFVEQKRYFSLFFYLADDTVEVIEKGGGEGGFSARLLRRCRLRKPGGHASDYITASDLRCGSAIDVFGRSFVILRCDEFTLEW